MVGQAMYQYPAASIDPTNFDVYAQVMYRRLEGHSSWLNRFPKKIKNKGSFAQESLSEYFEFTFLLYDSYNVNSVRKCSGIIGKPLDYGFKIRPVQLLAQRVE